MNGYLCREYYNHITSPHSGPPRQKFHWFLGSWWCNHMETCSTLPALCEGNHYKEPMMKSFDLFFVVSLTLKWHYYNDYPEKQSKKTIGWWYSSWREIVLMYMYTVSCFHTTMFTTPIAFGLPTYHPTKFLWSPQNTLNICLSKIKSSGAPVTSTG